MELIADPATDQEVPWLTHPAAWTVQDALGEVPAEDVAGQLGSLLESNGIGVLSGVGDRGGDERCVSGFGGGAEVVEGPLQYVCDVVLGRARDMRLELHCPGVLWERRGLSPLMKEGRSSTATAVNRPLSRSSSPV